MISFKRVKNSDIDDVALVQDQVLYEEATGYLYADFLNTADNTLERKVILAPSSASNTTYDNTDSGLEAETVQDAIDELGGSYEVIDFTVDENGKLMYSTGNATVSDDTSWVRI